MLLSFRHLTIDKEFLHHHNLGIVDGLIPPKEEWKKSIRSRALSFIMDQTMLLTSSINTSLKRFLLSYSITTSIGGGGTNERRFLLSYSITTSMGGGGTNKPSPPKVAIHFNLKN